MRLFRMIGPACVVFVLGCTSAAPAAPTTAPAPPATAAPTVAKPAAASPAASVAASPSAAAAARALPSPSAAAQPAASPASSPAAGPSPSPLAAGSPVSLPQMMLQGTPTPGFTLTAAGFKDGDTLPMENTCAPSGDPNNGKSPVLSWTGAPSGARSFAIIEQDMDVPPPNGPVVHWLIYNIPATTTSLTAGLPQQESLPNGANQAVNSIRSIGYIGSCPPPGAAPHHYVFQLFALDNTVPVQPQSTLPTVAPSMQGHVLAQTQLGATFGR
jgi:Raf kinase inhibitor-like YbhB/YbcL family protein